MNVCLVIYRTARFPEQHNSLEERFSPTVWLRQFHSTVPAPAWDLARRAGQTGRQDVTGEVAFLAQQIVFALGERSNPGSLPPASSLSGPCFQVPPLHTWALASPKVKLQGCIYVF